MIISKTDIVFILPFSSHWGWSPQIRMDLVTKGLGPLSHSLVFDWLATSLCKSTGIAVMWALRFVKFNPIDNTLDCKGNLTNLRRELHLSLAKGNPK
jgi:hypothetical protein